MTSRRLSLFLGALLAAGGLPAHAQDPAAVSAATEAYARLGRGDATGAAQAAERAVAAAPDHLDYRLLLADSLLRGGRPRDAYDALEPVRDLADYRVQTRRAEAAAGAGLKAEAAEAYGLAAPSAPDAQSRAHLIRSRLFLLLELGRHAEARAEFDQAWATSALSGPAPLDAAMLAVAVGRDDAAQDAFALADGLAPLTGRAALDAGYSARRLGRDADAVRFFKQGLDTLPDDADLPPQQRFDIRREIETLERHWGGSASLSQGVVSTASAATPGADTVTQLGGEAWYRLAGYRNGRPIDVFARAFGTVHSEQGAATGGDTVQGWLGVRWKPFSETNLNLEASKMIALGDLARDDVMLRAAWSAESSADLRFDRDSWPSWRLYGDLAHIIDDDQTLGVLEGRAGWTWRLTDHDLFTPGVGVRGYYDSSLGETTAVGAGPRLSWRHWFREDRYAAPASYVDLSLGYDFSLSGDERGSGLSAAMSVAY